MITYNEIQISKLEDYDQKCDEKYKSNTLCAHIPEELLDDDVINKLKTYIGTRCNRIVLEYPYYDSDYLSTYYIHHAKKMISASKHCCRLHFWKHQLYYGYMVLRPTTSETKISRTLLEPELLVDELAYLMLGRFRAHLLGVESTIRCFPWMRQETDISVCAHVAVWSLLKYYGNTFKDYMDTTVGAIVEKTNNSWGRKTPSLGLSPVQISDVMKEYGFSPLILGRDSMDKEQFFDTVISYVESGIPLIGFVDIREEHHAVTIIGHAKPNYDTLDKKDLVNVLMDKETNEQNLNILPNGRLINGLFVSDDRLFPYQKIMREIPDRSSKTGYCVAQFKYVIVPLYQRMQLSYNDIYARFVEVYKRGWFQWKDLRICRIYITSATSLKEGIANDNSIDPTLQKIILHLTMSRFVWCVDLAKPEEYRNNMISGRLIADSTAPTYDDNPWILIHDDNKVQVYDAERREILTKNIQIKPYKLYVHNLKVVNGGSEYERL